MTHTFEDQLREDLHAATSRPAYGSVDPALVIAEGSRLVRRRRLRQGAGATAAVALLTVGGFLATDHDRTTSAPPAGPSTTVDATATRSAYFNVTQPTNRQFVVEVAPEAQADANVSYYEVEVATKERTLLGRSSTRGLGDGATWGRGDQDPRVILGIMPQYAYGMVALFGPEFRGGARTDVSPVHGTDYQAFLLQADDPATAEKFQGFVWSTPDQTIQGPDGQLPAARFPSSDRQPVRVWLAPQQQVFGLDRMGIQDVTPIAEPGRFAVQHSSYRDGGTERGTAFGLVEKGSSDVRLRFSDGTTVTRAVETAPLGGTGYDAFLAEASGPEGKVRLLEVSWTDPSGAKLSREVSRG